MLQGFAFFEPVFDVGDNVTHTRIRAISGEQVVDLGDDHLKGHHFGIPDSARSNDQNLWGGQARLRLSYLLRQSRTRLLRLSLSALAFGIVTASAVPAVAGLAAIPLFSAALQPLSRLLCIARPPVAPALRAHGRHAHPSRPPAQVSKPSTSPWTSMSYWVAEVMSSSASARACWPAAASPSMALMAVAPSIRMSSRLASCWGSRVPAS